MRRSRAVPESSSWFSQFFGRLVEALGALALATFLYVLIMRLGARSDFLIPGEELHTAVAAGLIGCTLALLVLPTLMSGWSQTIRSFALFTAIGLVVVLCAVRTGVVRDPATTPLNEVLRGLQPLHSQRESASLRAVGSLLPRVPKSFNPEIRGGLFREFEAIGRSSGRRARRAG